MARKDRWLKKAGDWLAERAFALDCWSNGEAIVYLHRHSLEAHDHRLEPLRQLWERNLDSIGHTQFIYAVNPVTGVHTDTDPRFWRMPSTGGDSTTVDATIMRLADWGALDVPGKFWRKMGRHLRWEADKHFQCEKGVEFSQSEIPACVLFSLCRSDLALREMPEALRAWRREIHQGKQKPTQPWIVCRRPPDGRAYTDSQFQFLELESVAIAAALAFGGLRMSDPTGEEGIIAAAGRFLIDKQLLSGAWPRIGFRTEENASVFHTAMAMHALWLGKPDGWEAAMDQGADWLLRQQDSVGCWSQPESVSTFLTVLVLDALELASERNTKDLTFKLAPKQAVPMERKKKPGKRTARNQLPEEVMRRLKEIPAKDEKSRMMKILVWEHRRLTSAEIARLVETEIKPITASRIRQIILEVNKFLASGVPDRLRLEQVSALKKIVKRLKTHHKDSFSQGQWHELVGDFEEDKYGELLQEIMTSFLSTDNPATAEKAGSRFLYEMRRNAEKIDSSVDPNTGLPYDD